MDGWMDGWMDNDDDDDDDDDEWLDTKIVATLGRAHDHERFEIQNLNLKPLNPKPHSPKNPAILSLRFTKSNRMHTIATPTDASWYGS